MSERPSRPSGRSDGRMNASGRIDRLETGATRDGDVWARFMLEDRANAGRPLPCKAFGDVAAHLAFLGEGFRVRVFGGFDVRRPQRPRGGGPVRSARLKVLSASVLPSRKPDPPARARDRGTTSSTETSRGYSA